MILEGNLRDRPVRRLAQLYVGLALYGLSTALMIESGLGNMPWDVLAQGLDRHTPLSFGGVIIAVGALCLLLWIPLRQRPGFGTISNVLFLGVFADLSLAAVPTPDQLAVRIPMLLGGILLNGFATACYIGARLGPGPRDGLMTGLAARGHSVRLVRTGIEVVVVATGWLLGGTVGVGTLLYALSIGPLAHRLLPVLTVREAPKMPPVAEAAAL